MSASITIFWFRRDLRLEDNAGFYRALKNEKNVLPLFIFDREILDKLETKKDPRVAFIHSEITRLQKELKTLGSTLVVRYGSPTIIWEVILKVYKINAVYTNHDYEPYAKKRDAAIEALLSKKDIPFKTYKDQVIFEKEEVVKGDGSPYVVFTPYSKIWKNKLNSRLVKNKVDKSSSKISYYFKPYPNKKYFKNLYQTRSEKIISLQEMGFESDDQVIPGRSVPRKIIKKYDDCLLYTSPSPRD